MSTASDLERYMLDLINEERSNAGLSAVALEQRLNDSAEDHSSWVLETDIFSHTGVGGSSATDRMRDAGFDFSGNWRSGENIGLQSERGAAGFFDDVEDIHDNLMNSSGHRANILNPTFEYVGIGIEIGNYSGYDAVMITQNFAATDGNVLLDGGGSQPVPPPPPTPIPTPTPPPPPPSDDPDPVIGTAGNDRLLGTNEGEVVRGNGGKDLLIGKGGADTIDGGDGNDKLRGGSGADQLDGGAGKDVADYLDAGSGVRVDMLNMHHNEGYAAGDAYTSIENVTGSRHDDDLRGSDGDNRLVGGNGDDVLLGRGGRDVLIGGRGEDVIVGQNGNDKLIGKQDADTFVFERGMDRDVVTDFEDNLDLLDFSGFDFSSKTELFNLADERNGDVHFDLGNGDYLTVNNMAIAQLSDDVLI